MKKRLGLFLFMATIFGCITFNSNTLVVNAGANDKTPPATSYASVNNDVEAFYTSTSAGSVEGLKGDALLEQLAKVLEVNHKYYNNYGELRGGLAYSDEDPENKSNIYYFYSGVSVSNTWGGGNIYNREHVWPKANSNGLFTSESGPNPVNNNSRGAGADIHHLRPEAKGVNSTRSNHPFADLNKSGTEVKYNGVGTGNYYQSSKFEPRDGVKGDVARILMYMYTHYSTEVSENADRASISDSKTASKTGALDITNVVYTSTGTDQAAWELLLDWNELDPVDDFEMNRNDYCTSVTGVRNPFIDHPEFATMIWDTSYSGSGALNDNGGNTSEHTFTAVDKVEATCVTNGMEAHYTCSHCDNLFVKSGSSYNVVSESSLVILASHSYGSLVPEVKATCETDGMKTYYQCSKCDKYFDSNKVETTLQQLKTSATGHNEVIDVAVKETCTEDGLTQGSHCGTCNEVLVKQEVIKAKGHTGGTATCTSKAICSECGQEYGELLPHNYGTLVVGTATSCEDTGVLSHYQCSSCNKYFNENKVETTLQELTVTASGHTYGQLVTKVDASCEESGMKAHFYCVPCNTYFDDNKVVTTKQDLIIPAGNHKYKSIDEVKATCTHTGVKQHFRCESCEKIFLLENNNYREVNEEELLLEKTDHNYGDEIPEVKATCETDGNSAHYKCKDCDKLFIKSANSYISVTLQEITTKAFGHSYYKVNEKPATCVLEGNKEHYKCSRCDKVFTLSGSDYVEVDPASLVLSKVVHTYDNKCDTTCNTCNEEREVSEHKDFNKDGKCDHCGTQLEVKKDNTTRNIILISIGGVTLLGLLVLLFIFKKRV